ncbi:MAG: hypothetical protein J5830_04405 [Clostridia bacterium]|nr:hypothetical protein [Clostridia bacterium]
MKTARFLSILVIIAMLVSFAACGSSGGNISEQSRTGTATDTAAETEEQIKGVPDDVTKVILLSGQSNAVGYTYRNFFETNDYYKQFYSTERLAAADAGYPDILIRYSNNALDPDQDTCGNDTFEPVRFGMGARNVEYKEEWGLPFGPEMGIAEYLTEKFPGEKFYIIKCATSGANISNRFNPDKTSDPKNLVPQLISFAKESLEELKSQGLKPEIISFCWVHGGTDAEEGFSSLYAGVFGRLVNKIETELAEYMPKNGMSIADAGVRASNTNYEEMNAAKQAFAEKSSKRYYFDTMWFLAGRDHYDRGHYDCYPMIQVGNSLGECIEKAMEDYGNPAVLK